VLTSRGEAVMKQFTVPPFAFYVDRGIIASKNIRAALDRLAADAPTAV
jgi:hypothetical protein